MRYLIFLPLLLFPIAAQAEVQVTYRPQYGPGKMYAPPVPEKSPEERMQEVEEQLVKQHTTAQKIPPARVVQPAAAPNANFGKVGGNFGQVGGIGPVGNNNAPPP